jgi:phenylalanyl-tRNA synthetase beta chain
MRVPVSWLRELVPVDVPTDELAVRLSMTGTAVDKIHRVGGHVSGVVAAKVLEVEDVRGSRKLCVSKVDAGEYGTFQVVAGAKNFRAGDVVPFARPGARLREMRISERKLAGVQSQGMLCSADELGISESRIPWIVTLDPGTPPGADVAALLHLDDEVIEFEIYPNRPDLLSVAGIAREIALLCSASLHVPDPSPREVGPPAESLTSVTIEDPGGCPRYLARVVEAVTFAPSPVLVQARLHACGFRPLGNIVDATNYVLLLAGQPLHAFDLDRLSEERIVVRRARAGERLQTLDEIDRELEADDLVIADARDAQAIAGVMGGGASEVGESTTRVLIESAYFDPVTIARTARRHHMRTEASVRFERGADPEAVPRAAALCAELIAAWAGGRVAAGAVDAGGPPARQRLRLRSARVEKVLGVHVPDDESDGYLRGLGCVLTRSDGVADVLAPSWRPDLEREIDLIEEIARLYGYENIPTETPRGLRGSLTREQQYRRRVRDALIGAGLSEANLLSLVTTADVALVGADAIRVTNPTSVEHDRLRPSLLPGLLHAARRNAAHGVPDVRLFEIGTAFVGWESDADLPREELRLGVVVTGHEGGHVWHTPARPVDAYDAKGIVELVMDELGVDGWETGPCEAMPFHPGRSSAVMVGGVEVGRFGEIRPRLRDGLDLGGGAAVVELALAPLVERARDSLRVRDLPRFPATTRDLALVVDEDVHAGDIERTIRDAAGELAESVVLFDVYRGEPIPHGRKNLAFRLTLRAPDRTLTSAEADAARQAVVDAAVTRHGAMVR